ncbi:acetyl/propionyl/methylcrotonyl-CoA carboxylase subunit alpha [Streptomyces sp. BH-SS-21]|uniref:Biotin-dependent 3-methylcrotonyl-coenzyme A carboxylase alpha1 subunit n=1 Tax=Streptomyces liliiviolaceus TaxID=2823109 RepID=A0A940XTV1_9ACTN|nr:acetyl/propionyl/methylcrotonyl-CoA carboxylase subunit alpha [Streptomyces liliiviolaceus]MBQ0848838.1 acetyl/propionyl/methylcrotonyl-CoA carboxylase subunit alpha [Streptomyces liliiviolaceus]
MFDTVLVANRGEIAVRVIRTLRSLGVRSVAVYSDADADARHVREADTAVRIGPAPAAESYLSAERLLEAAARTGAQAVHPGYGFLAENADFARACTEAGLVFIGPSSDAISLMGDKIRAKETVRAAGVPVVPGSSGSGLSDEQLAASAREIGMPVLLKPSAGGGGKGMRLVRDAAVLPEEIAAARREARSSFGDDTLLVERWVDRPRHIEIQVLADGHGNVVHLGERECSLQRRHQKIIEEAPSVFLDEKTRAAMGEAAVQAARSCGYSGAGTVEFIVPGDDPASYYFMEMNTRLQVEHPVTELITGIDLVEWQLRVAAGERLDFAQEDVTFTGHAVEARVCAEDPARGFLPSGGTILSLYEPQGDGVRTDSGLTEGTEVGSLYDPMLSKVIAYGPDRATALRRLRAALAQTVTLGVQTNAGFLRKLLAHPAVVAGELDTGLVEREVEGLVSDSVPGEVYVAAGVLRQASLFPHPAPSRNQGLRPRTPRPQTPDGLGGWTDPFSVPSGWRLGGEAAWTVHHVRVPGHDAVTVRVRSTGSGTEVRLGDDDGEAAGSGAPDGAAVIPPSSHWVAGGAAESLRGSGGWPPVSGRGGAGEEESPSTLTLHLDGQTHTFHRSGTWLGRDGDAWNVMDHDPVTASLSGAAHGGADSLTAPMPGTVTVVKVAAGDEVSAGQSLLVVEAMKMEHVISAPHAGTVTELDVTPGTTVAMDQVLAVIAPQEPTAPLEEQA